jgi:hypothetical protein
VPPLRGSSLAVDTLLQLRLVGDSAPRLLEGPSDKE